MIKRLRIEGKCRVNDFSKRCQLLALHLFLPFYFLILSPSEAHAQSNHNLELAKSLDIFNNLYTTLDMFYVDSLKPKQAIKDAIDGMLEALDPYTEYYPQEDSKDLQMMLTGKYAGIGALIKYHMGLKRVVIDEPYEGMPAAEVGVKKGDIILSIDDSLMTDKKVDYVSSHLRGDAGTSFVLKVHRPSTDKDMKFKITRRNIKFPNITYAGMLADSIGYINLNQFTEGCAKEVRREFVELKKQGAKALVFDLRGNGGGSEMEAVDIVNLWVPQGQMVVENRGKVKQANRVYTTRLEPVDTVMPIVVMVNGETASASEITAGALQDLDRAIILGTRTYGKGLVQVPMDLPYNTNVKITTSKYYIPSGRCIQAINYSRDGGGGYKERIADSLTHVFHTRAGREVRDGGGLKPDIECKPDSIPNIVYYLSGGGLDSTEVLFDYVVDYVNSHPSIAPANEFSLSDADWEAFKQRVAASGFKYDTMSKKKLDDLVSTAKFEGYYDEAKDIFEALEKTLHHDLDSELEKHRQLIQRLVELDIVAAYYYQAGSVAFSLKGDKQMLEALRLLKAPGEYTNMLSPHKK